MASVSCIYGLGNPEEYKARVIQVSPGETVDRDELLLKLVNVFYTRNDIDFAPGTFRVRGDQVEVFPAYFEDRPTASRSGATRSRRSTHRPGDGGRSSPAKATC